MPHQLAHHALDGRALLCGDRAIAGGDIHDKLEETNHIVAFGAEVETPELLVVVPVVERGRGIRDLGALATHILRDPEQLLHRSPAQSDGASAIS